MVLISTTADGGGAPSGLILGPLSGHRRRIVIVTAAPPPGGYPPARDVR